MIVRSIALVALASSPLTADAATIAMANIGNVIACRAISTNTVPHSSVPNTALAMMSPLRLCRSTTVPPNTSLTCVAIWLNVASHPASTTDWVSEKAISEIAKPFIAAPIVEAVSAVNH